VTHQTRLVSYNIAGTAAVDNSGKVDVVVASGVPFVAFTSAGDNLVAGYDSGGTLTNSLYVRNMATGEIAVAFVNSAGTPITGSSVSSNEMATSGTNLYLIVYTMSDLVPDDTNGVHDGYLRTVPVNNLATGTTTRVSLGMGQTQFTTGSRPHAITPNGRFATFTTGLTNPLTGTNTDYIDVYVRYMDTGTTAK
jgi:hypothetical protein